MCPPGAPRVFFWIMFYGIGSLNFLPKLPAPTFRAYRDLDVFLRVCPAGAGHIPISRGKEGQLGVWLELGASLELGKRKGGRTGALSGLSAPPSTHAIKLQVLRNSKFEADLQVIRKVYLQKQEENDIFCLTV